MVAVRLFSDLFQAKEKDWHVTASPSLWPGVVRKTLRISKESPCKEGTFPGHSTVDHDRERSGRANLRRHVDRASQAGRPGGISPALGSPSCGSDGRGPAALPSARPGRDITQGAFLLAWRGLPRFQVGLPFRPWLMRILYRHALDVMERQRVYLQPLSPLALEAPVRASSPYECDPQELVAEREELSRALAQLNADQRRVIALRYGADLSEAEIAQVLR